MKNKNEKEQFKM